MTMLCDGRALHLLEYVINAHMLHSMPMLHGPKHRQRLMAIGEALMSRLMSLVLMILQVNVDVLHACHHHGLARPNRTSLC